MATAAVGTVIRPLVGWESENTERKRESYSALSEYEEFPSPLRDQRQGFTWSSLHQVQVSTSRVPTAWSSGQKILEGKPCKFTTGSAILQILVFLPMRLLPVLSRVPKLLLLAFCPGRAVLHWGDTYPLLPTQNQNSTGIFWITCMLRV